VRDEGLNEKQLNKEKNKWGTKKDKENGERWGGLMRK
jgi:hypothetical protein